jgi:zinc protease
MTARSHARRALGAALAAAALAAPAAAQPAAGPAAPGSIATVLQPSRSPLVSFRLVFMTGAASDPEGKEGVAALTASMLAGGGTRALPYDKVVEAMYPMATDFDAQVDKEMTVFSGTTHVDNLEAYYGLVRQMLLEPGFRDEDFQRLRDELVNFLKVSLRGGNDEELGKERLYNLIYAGHPYEHHNAGTVSSLERLTVDDVRAFYRANYARGNLVIGLAGNYPAPFVGRMQADFAALPATAAAPAARLPAPAPSAGTKIDIVQRDTRSTAFSLGFPIDVRRGHADWPALALVASYFGQHRSSNSYLYGKLREARGLNYGDYAYVEYFPRGMFQFDPDPNLGRQQQIYQIWIRPVEPQNGLFTLRAALYEHDRLVREGMTQETFEATREFLTKYVDILTQSQDAALGYALDSRYYGIADFPTYMRQELARLTLADVNRVIRERLGGRGMRVVVVTKDGAALRDAILAGAPSPITYNSPKPQAILDEDRVIQTYPIRVAPGDVTLTPVEQVFQ